MSKSLFERTNIKGLIWEKWNSNLFHILTCTYFLKKMQEFEFLIFLIDTVKYFKSYDPKQESKQFIYWDTNNFYGYAMSKFLPKSEFR